MIYDIITTVGGRNPSDPRGIRCLSGVSVFAGVRDMARQLDWARNQGERRSRIELELKTANFLTEKRHAGRVTSTFVAHSLFVSFSGLFPVPQLRRDDEDAPHFFKMKSRGTLHLDDKMVRRFSFRARERRKTSSAEWRNES